MASFPPTKAVAMCSAKLSGARFVTRGYWQARPFLYQMVSRMSRRDEGGIPRAHRKRRANFRRRQAEETRFTRTVEAVCPLEDDIYNFAIQSVRPGPGDKLERNKALRKRSARTYQKIKDASQTGTRSTTLARTPSSCTTRLGYRSISSRTRFAISAWISSRKASSARWKSSEHARAHLGKARTKKPRIPVYSKLAETFKTEPDFYFGTQTRDARIEGYRHQARRRE